MSRQFKTSKSSKTAYTYYSADGTKTTITPSGSGITETDIGLLHSYDDADVDEQRRYDYRVRVHLDAYHDGDDTPAADRNKYLLDESHDPEQVLLANEESQAHHSQIDKLSAAMVNLLPQQRELFKKAYIDRRTNVDIASEEGVTEAAIRNRLKKMHDRLRKLLL